MKVLSDGNYKQIVMQQARQSRTIRSATIELLDGCNFRCEHCYVRDTYHKIANVSRLKDYLLELRQIGCIWLLLTGGEVFLHPDFLDIYIYAHRLGFEITIFTNGYLLTDKILQTFTKAPPTLIEITIYGSCPTIFDAFVGVPGAFSTIDKNIDLIHNAHIPLKLKSVLMKSNLSDFDAIKAYAHSKGLEFRWDCFLQPSLAGNIAPLENRIEAHQAAALDACDQNYIVQLSKSLANPPTLSNDLYTCSAGYNSIFIDADFNASICMMARNITVSLRDYPSIIDAQYDLIQIRENKPPLSVTDPCYSCVYRPLCHYCPGQFLLSTGTEYCPPHWNCSYAKSLKKHCVTGG